MYKMCMKSTLAVLLNRICFEISPYNGVETKVKILTACANLQTPVDNYNIDFG